MKGLSWFAHHGANGWHVAGILWQLLCFQSVALGKSAALCPATRLWLSWATMCATMCAFSYADLKGKNRFPSKQMHILLGMHGGALCPATHKYHLSVFMLLCADFEEERADVRAAGMRGGVVPGRAQTAG
eukprot:scaffold240945_cov13-Tisochrysis_lutea.AAC.1